MRIILITIAFLQYIQAYDCFSYRLPLSVGCDTADTVINSIKTTGSDIVFGGWTKCSSYLPSSSSKAAIIGKTDTT